MEYYGDAVDQNTALFTLPEELRPSSQENGIFGCIESGELQAIGYVVYSNGEVHHTSGQLRRNIFGILTY